MTRWKHVEAVHRVRRPKKKVNGRRHRWNAPKRARGGSKNSCGEVLGCELANDDGYGVQVLREERALKTLVVRD